MSFVEISEQIAYVIRNGWASWVGKVHTDKTPGIIQIELHSVSSFDFIIMPCGFVRMDNVDVQRAICLCK